MRFEESEDGQGVEPRRPAGPGEVPRVLVEEEAEGLPGGEEDVEVEAQRLPLGKVRVGRAKRAGGLGRRPSLGRGGEAEEGERHRLAGRAREALAERAARGAEKPLAQVGDADLEVLVRVLRPDREGEQEQARREEASHRDRTAHPFIVPRDRGGEGPSRRAASACRA